MSRFTLTLALLLLTTTAHAQQTRDAVGNGRSALEAQLTSGARTRVRSFTEPLGPTETSTELTPFATLQLRVTQHITRLTPELVLEFDLDAALGVQDHSSPAGEWAGGWIGSPWLGVSIASRSASQTLRASVGIAPPLASLRREFGGENLPVGGWSGWNGWLAGRGVLPFGFLGLGEWRFANFDVGVDVALIIAPLFPWRDSPVREPTGFGAWAAAGAWLTGHLTPELDLGARLQVVASVVDEDASSSPTATDSTSANVALSPFLRYWFSHAASPSPTPAFAELRMNFNFIDPYGPVFVDDDYTWSLALAAGTNW